MSQQLPLRLRLEGHTSLDDYIGSAADKLLQFEQLVYLSGEEGSGKSHLLQGLCHRALEEQESALYLPMLTAWNRQTLSVWMTSTTLLRGEAGS